jgi:hypothetical protein
MQQSIRQGYQEVGRLWWMWIDGCYLPWSIGNVMHLGDYYVLSGRLQWQLKTREKKRDAYPLSKPTDAPVQKVMPSAGPKDGI